MASTLIDTLLDLVTPDLLSGASRTLGEPEIAVSKGLTASFPALLSGVAERAGDTGTMQRLLALANDPALDTRLLANPTRALDALEGGVGGGGLAALASSLLPLAFGDRAGAIATTLARYAGLRSGSSGTSLLSLAAPLVLGVLRDRAQHDGLGATGLGRWLGGQREALRGALPPGFVHAGAPALPPHATASQRGPRWLLPLLLLVGLGLIWTLLRGERAPEVATRTEEPPAVGAAPPAGAPARTRLTLPDGAALDVPADSLEARLVRSARGPADTASWFDFDRLMFETGSATLEPQSREQLANVARILAAYPSLRVKIGGYTDDAGDRAANLALSQRRAESVRAELVSLGVTPERVEAEGYGAEHPVADNATEEGRARNRRIALRVLEK